MLSASQVQSIAALDEPVLTVYLNTNNPNPSQHPRLSSDLAWIRKEFDSRAGTLDAPMAKRFHKECARVEDFLKDRHPEEKALVLFAGSNTWSVLPVHIAVTNEVHWGKPAIGQLFRLLGEHNRYGVAVVDRRTARFFQFYLGELDPMDEDPFDIERTVNESMRKGHGADPDLFAHREDAQYERIWQDIADHATSLAKEHGFAAIFLLGSEQIGSSIQKHFASKGNVPVVTLPEDLGKFSATDIRQRVTPLVDEYEQNLHVAEVRELLSSNFGVVTNADEALAKLQHGEIAKLFVAEAHELHLRECSQCKRVSRTGDSKCSECGGEWRTVPMFETLARLALTFGTKLEFVTGEAGERLVEAGGLAGRLRQLKHTAAS